MMLHHSKIAALRVGGEASKEQVMGSERTSANSHKRYLSRRARNNGVIIVALPLFRDFLEPQSYALFKDNVALDWES